MKVCNKCEEPKELNEFEAGRNTCKVCRNDYHREKRAKNPRQTKAYSVKQHYGITLEEYEGCMNTANCCEICGDKDRLCYDHNHTTGKFRGVLCHWCNSALGDFKDRKVNLEKAITYLSTRGSYG